MKNIPNTSKKNKNYFIISLDYAIMFLIAHIANFICAQMITCIPKTHAMMNDYTNSTSKSK